MSRKLAARADTPTQRRTTRYRKRMRAEGLRPVQIWVPDTAAPSFAQKLRRQVARLRGRPEEREAFEFIESLRDPGD